MSVLTIRSASSIGWWTVWTLARRGFVRAAPNATGRPGYDPADLLKLDIDGDLNRVRLSRRLEVETHRNIEVIWLRRRLSPDVKTMADFRRANRSAFRQVFREFVALCRDLDLFGRELVAVDGTRIKVVNNRNRNVTTAKRAAELRQSDERLERYLAPLDVADDAAAAEVDASADALREKIAAVRKRRARLNAYREALERNSEARENLGVERIDAVADRGYFKVEEVEACDAASVVAYVPKPARSPAARNLHLTKDDFRYDADNDVYLCPGGHRLAPRYRNAVRGPVSIDDCSRAACSGLRDTLAMHQGRVPQDQGYENEAALDRMVQRIGGRPGPADIRRKSFGSMTQWMSQGAFLMRRLESVRGEFSLTSLAYNRRRAITLLGVQRLIASARP